MVPKMEGWDWHVHLNYLTDMKVSNRYEGGLNYTTTIYSYVWKITSRSNTFKEISIHIEDLHIHNDSLIV